jgi:predicted anti-sigma-YlaC factor YlaD
VTVDCTKLLEELGDYLDKEAREDLCRAIEEHLKSCQNCRVEVDKMRKTILLYQSDQPQALPAGVSVRLQEALAREYGAAASPTD